MNLPRFISVLLIVFGAIVAVYAKAGAEQNVYILIAGIVLLMLGVYRISKNIPSKNDQETNADDSQES
jgi:putative Mn2+ efflux pump MntP